MRDSLKDLLLKSVRAVSDVAPNSFLGARYQALVDTMEFVERTPEASYAVKALRKLFSQQNWILDAKATEGFFQLVGEAHFWLMAQLKGVQLDRVPKSGPDFRVRGESTRPIHFEVKTLSVAGGWRSLAAMADSSFEGQLSLQRQLDGGSRFATAELSTAPHGQVPRGLELTTICRNLIKKASGNIDQAQFSIAPTFLVLNQLLIDGWFNGTTDLRPVAAGFPEASSLRTGALWTLGFGSIGQLVHGIPDHVGAPGIEGILEIEGVLVNPEYECVAGMVLVVHRLGCEPRLSGLVRSTDRERWHAERPNVLEAFHALVGKDWNDDRDSNGWQVTEH